MDENEKTARMLEQRAAIQEQRKAANMNASMHRNKARGRGSGAGAACQGCGRGRRGAVCSQATLEDTLHRWLALTNALPWRAFPHHPLEHVSAPACCRQVASLMESMRSIKNIEKMAPNGRIDAAMVANQLAGL